MYSLAGVSRSSTIVVAYVMSVTDLDYRSALDAVRASRSCASPNFGFQRQLLTFEYDGLEQVSFVYVSESIYLNQLRQGSPRH